MFEIVLTSHIFYFTCEVIKRTKKERGAIYIVEADSFLSFLLTRKDEVLYSEIYKIQDRLYSKHPDIILSISGPAITRSFAHFPEFFIESEDGIKKNPSGSSFYQYWVSRMPQRIIEALCESFA